MPHLFIASIKAWIDHIVSPGLTFKYTETGPARLINAKKVIVLISSGGVYSLKGLVSLWILQPLI